MSFADPGHRAIVMRFLQGSAPLSRKSRRFLAGKTAVRNGPILASKNLNGTAWREDVMQRANHQSRKKY